ncbi:MAG: hypothetical protein LUH22_12050 [Bacteroides sp.]|nr:hypothetical protein [Bacteroides sp.]
MKNIPYIILLLILFSCGQESNSKEKIKLTFQVNHERGNWYSIHWKDTLGKGDGYHEDDLTFIKRPKEIWCVITDLQNDTLGYYQGMSTAQTFAYFHTTDTVVILNFMTGLNLFPDRTLEDKRETNKYPIRYEPIEFKLVSRVGEEMEIELKEK